MKTSLRRISFILPLAGCLLGPASRPSPAADAPWQTLFNGKDLAGWVRVHDVTFEVVDSNLRLVKGMGWLRTEKEYEDFILEFEWRALEDKYDSGMFIRAGLDGKPWPKDGWQVNLRYDSLGSLVKATAPCFLPKHPACRSINGSSSASRSKARKPRSPWMAKRPGPPT